MDNFHWSCIIFGTLQFPVNIIIYLLFVHVRIYVYVGYILWFECIIFIQHIIIICIVCNTYVIYNQVNVLALFHNYHIVSILPHISCMVH